MVEASYVELAPVAAVQDVVRCDWARTCGAAGELVIVPDGCTDIVWRSDGALFVAGPDRGPATHRHDEGTEYVGVRLRPGTAATVLGVDIDELCDQQVPLSILWGPDADRLAEQMLEAPSAALRRRFLAGAVARRRAEVSLDDPIVAAVDALELDAATVDNAVREAGLGIRQLRRRFVQQVGYGPKTYQRVMRFRRFLVAAQDRRAGLAELALRAGYADQAHLTRECRRLTGRTPARVVDDRIVQDEVPPRAR